MRAGPLVEVGHHLDIGHVLIHALAISGDHDVVAADHERKVAEQGFRGDDGRGGSEDTGGLHGLQLLHETRRRAGVAHHDPTHHHLGQGRRCGRRYDRSCNRSRSRNRRRCSRRGHLSGRRRGRRRRLNRRSRSWLGRRGGLRDSRYLRACNAAQNYRYKSDPCCL